MNPIGLHTGYWRGTEIESDIFRMLDMTHEAGLDVIEIGIVLFMKMTAGECGELARRLREYGMSATLNGGLDETNDLASDDESVREEGIHYCKSVLEKMPELNLTLWSGCNYSRWLRCPSPYDNSDPIEEKKRALALCLESMREIMPTAERLGIDYCFEVLNRFEQFIFNTSEEAVAFAEKLNSPRAKLLLDVFHMNIEEDSMAQAILHAAKNGKLGHIHAGETNRRVPGIGVTDTNWLGFADALKKASYQGAIIMEPFVLANAYSAKHIHIWRDLCTNKSLPALMDDAREGGQFLRSLF